MNLIHRTTGWLALALCLVFVPASGVHAQEAAAPSPAVSAIRAEVLRAKELELPGMPRPHHIAVTLLGEEEAVVEASLGAIIKEDRDHARVLKVEVRVGDPSFDSSNFLGTAEEPVVVAPTALQDDPEALRRSVWILADRAYKNATETYEAKRAHFESMARGGADDLDDFGAAPVERFRDGKPVAVPSTTSYADLARTVSNVFAQHPNVHRSTVRIMAHTRTRTFVDSAGTAIEDTASLLQVEIVARTQADDGMVLADHASFSSRSFGDMPSVEALTKVARELAVRLEKTRVAPVLDDYAGPVLFEGRAAPQLLRFLLADELSATPPPEPNLGNDVATASSLSTRIGWRVLPLGFGVVDDPTIQRGDGFPLIGGYQFDDEGVRAQRVTVVENGRLRALLSSRTPSESFPVSNGHGRAGVTGHARGRVGNLLVTASGGLPAAALRARLLAAAKREGVDYGIVVAGLDDPSVTERAMMATAGASGGVMLPRPTEVYRIRAGAKPELVRGASLHALRTRDLRHIAAAGREPFAYAYMASASPVRSPGSFGGDIPTSIVAPSVLLPDVDVTRPTTPHPLPPIVPMPPRSKAP